MSKIFKKSVDFFHNRSYNNGYEIKGKGYRAMKKIGFDNEKYLKLQSENIRERISKFDNKLYLEFGGKLFDDFHASRVLPGFAPDSKIRMLSQVPGIRESSSCPSSPMTRFLKKSTAPGRQS